MYLCILTVNGIPYVIFVTLDIRTL